MKLINLHTKYLGKEFIFYEEIDSTQNEIWRLIKQNNIQNGTLIMANIQTNGKGTHGRTWYTDSKGDIAISMFLQTNCKTSKIEGITIDIAKIILDIFIEKYKIKLEIKEPNDIVFNNKKIGGILTESKTLAENTKFLVIGIGLNLVKTNFSEDIKSIATSIKKEFDIEIDRLKFIEELCNRLESNINKRIN